MSSKSRHILVGVAIFVGVVCASAYLFRDTVATGAVRFALARSSKLHCTEPELDISAGLDRIQLADIECTVNDGPIRYVRTQGLTTVRLHGLTSLDVHIEKATIDQRDRDVSHVETNTLGELGEIAGMTDMLWKGMLDSAELYSPTLPPVEIDELTMKRAGKVDSTLYGFRQTLDGDWNRSRAARVEAPGGSGPVSVRALDLRVTPQKGKLSASVYIGEPERGEEPDVTVEVVGRQLDGPRPQIDVEI